MLRSRFHERTYGPRQTSPLLTASVGEEPVEVFATWTATSECCGKERVSIRREFEKDFEPVSVYIDRRQRSFPDGIVLQHCVVGVLS